MKFEIELPDQFYNEDPDCAKFLQGLQMMVNRMAVSHFKYGPMGNKYPHSARAIDSANKRREMYERTGNTENCLDEANFNVIEYVLPSHPKAHFEAQTSAQSPGLVWKQE